MSRFDVVVIGADVNAMVSALNFAAQNKSVCLAANGQFGVSRFQTLTLADGAQVASLLQDTSCFPQQLIAALGLDTKALERVPKASGLFIPDLEQQGSGILLGYDVSSCQDELSRYSREDVDGFKSYRGFIERIRPFISSFLTTAPLDLRDLGVKGMAQAARKALALRRLGRHDMLELMRLAPMCVADLLNEFFQNERLKAALALPSLYGSWCGPFSPHTALNLLLYDASTELPLRQGAMGLQNALLKGCVAAGVRIIEEFPAEQILIEGGRVTGVRLADRSIVSCDLVASAADPKSTFFSLLAPGYLPTDFEHAIEHYRMRGTMALLHLSLKEPLRFSCRDSLTPERFRLVESMTQLEKAFDPVKYGRFGEDAVVEGFAFNPKEGVHTLTLEIHFVPCSLAQGWDVSARDRLQEVVLSKLSQYAPQCRDLINDSVLISPDQMAGEYGIFGGHLYHGEHAPDQILVRPALGASSYDTPISGLTLCGSGSFPGGGLTGLPGWLGSKAGLRLTGR